MVAAVLDILAIGDALVDVIATCEPEFLHARGLAKGAMRLITAAEADRLHEAMGASIERPGGSAANSIAAIGAMGGRAGFIGQVAADRLGDVFARDMDSHGVHFATMPLTGGAPTGRCLILVTPDGERTMSTAPGASHELAPAALDRPLIASAATLYLEGYLWGPPKPRAAMAAAIGIARAAGREIAFTVSGSVSIAGRRNSFAELIERGEVDLLFANEEEALQLAGRTDLDAAFAELATRIPTVVVTRGAAGASAVSGDRRVDVAAVPVARVVDTTGAGDLFAAGFLAARAKGAKIERCLEVGAIAASAVIGQVGARPGAVLKELIAPCLI